MSAAAIDVDGGATPFAHPPTHFNGIFQYPEDISFLFMTALHHSCSLSLCELSCVVMILYLHHQGVFCVGLTVSHI